MHKASTVKQHVKHSYLGGNVVNLARFADIQPACLNTGSLIVESPEGHLVDIGGPD